MENEVLNMGAPKRLEKTVILIDNNRRQKNYILRLLKKERIKIRAFDSADDALLELNVNNPPALIITGIFIPGTDGWRLCRLLRSPEYRAFNNVPILLVSTVFSVDAEARILADLGANAFLPLPTRGKRLIQEVETLMKGGREKARLNVLIIENSGRFMDNPREAFPERAFCADTATSAPDALRLLKKKPYNVIVLDFEPSSGTDKKLLGIIRKEFPKCICIIVSENRDIISVLSRLDLSVSVCLLKPVDAGHLADLCDRLLREQSLLYIKDLMEKRAGELRKHKIDYYHGIVQKMREHNNAEKKLSDSQTKLRYCLDYAPVGVMIRDLSGRYVEVNSFAEKLIGCGAGELHGASVTDILADDADEGAKRYLSTVLKDGCCESGGQFRFRCKDGRLIDVMVRSFKMTDEYYIAFIYDLSERRQTEEEMLKLRNLLRNSKKLESIGRMASGVAHDFNNMLSIILGNAEIALEDISPDQPVFEYMDEIMQAAKSSAEFTRQLLSFIRSQDVTPEVVDLNRAIKSIIKMLQRLVGDDIKINWNPGRDLRPVEINPSQVDQVLVNLCLNSRDAIEGEGRIDIETGNVAYDDAYFSVNDGVQPGNRVFLSVSDNGCGMNRETMNRVFEPFYTTKEGDKGTGLGMTLVYGIVKRNNGSINVYSEPGLGTSIKIHLPTYESDTEGAACENMSNFAAAQNNILLVEDEPGILDIVRRMLGQLGYSVLSLANPMEAVRLAEEHVLEIHLLITEVTMKEMNGRDLANKIRAVHPGLKRLFISDYAYDLFAHHGDLKDGDNFIQRPFSLPTLAAKVREALDGK